MKSFIKDLFGRDKPVRQRFFIIIFICGFFVGLMGVIACINLNSSPQAIMIAGSMTVILPLLAFIGYTSKKRQDLVLYCSLGILNFLILPTMYLTGGGIDCGIPSYFAFGLALTLFLTTGLPGIILTIIESIWFILTYTLSFTHPEILSHIPAYDVEGGAKAFTFQAISSNTLMVAIALGVLAKILFSMYRKEHKFVDEAIETVKIQALIDPLTGVYNRRQLYKFLSEQVDIANQSQANLSVAIFDIDKFKLLNDNYGHLVGDEVLKSLSNKINSFCKENEILARYGGEEFVIILPGCNHDEAMNRAEEIRVAIEQSRLSDSIPEDKPVTISGGVATFSKGMTDETLIALSDDNLYKAKESGRNKICG